MKTVKSDYTSLGLSYTMGPKLRTLVEQQLKEDLKFYGISNYTIKFDWSDSCIEGHDSTYLDGSLENFSGIAVFDEKDEFIAEGWMEFIHEGDFFLVYWEFVSTWCNEKKIAEKKVVGIPEHIWSRIPDGIKPVVEKLRMKTNSFK